MSNQIHKAMVDVMRKIGAIGKDRTNKFHRYNFRGIDDMYNAIHPALVGAGVFVLPKVLKHERETIKTKNGEALRVIMEVEYTFYAEDGSCVSAIVTGEAADTGDKAYNKAMSAAQKYAFIQTFSIPTEGGMIDSEVDTHQIKEESSTPSPTPAKRPTATDEIGVPADDLPRVDHSSTYTPNPKNPPNRDKKLLAQLQGDKLFYDAGHPIWQMASRDLVDMRDQCNLNSPKFAVLSQCVQWRKARRDVINRIKSCEELLAKWSKKENDEKVAEWQGKLYEAAKEIASWEMSDVPQAAAKCSQIIYESIDLYDYDAHAAERMLAIAADLEREATVKGGAK